MSKRDKDAASAVCWPIRSPIGTQASEDATDRRSTGSPIGQHRSADVLVVGAGAADHYTILFDRDLHRAVACPMLGVDRVILDRRVKP
jgi:hypothetical protein